MLKNDMEWSDIIAKARYVIKIDLNTMDIENMSDGKISGRLVVFGVTNSKEHLPDTASNLADMYNAKYETADIAPTEMYCLGLGNQPGMEPGKRITKHQTSLNFNPKGGEIRNMFLLKWAQCNNPDSAKFSANGIATGLFDSPADWYRNADNAAMLLRMYDIYRQLAIKHAPQFGKKK